MVAQDDWKRMVMIHIDAPHFCAGAIVRDGRILVAAPILGWTVGRSAVEVRAWARRKGYQIREM